LGADEQQALSDRIGAHDAADLVLGQIAVDRLPAPAAVTALEQVWLVVGKLVARGGDIDRIGIVRRDVDAADIGELGQALGRDFLPLLAAVTRDVHQPIVGRGPDLVWPVRRRGDAGAGGMDFGAGALAGDRSARGALPPRVVQAEVGRDALPA